MKQTNRALAALLAALLLPRLLTPGSLAAAPQVSVDEAVYVNLDYYGQSPQCSIVKGVNLNGNTEFTDYGEYLTVTNMTTNALPQQAGGSVTWRVPEDVRRFYYECTPKDGGIELPWTFDVSYKLDGVPVAAEKLAGADGLVEINIECIPNDRAEPYYQNNLLLQVAMMINMEDALSVEAPGSQLQSIGTYKAVIFAALPGEHATFTIRVGSTGFETSGIVMMMLPGTLDQMKQIKQIKEAKDIIGDSADRIYDGLDDILGFTQGLESGLKQTQAGLRQLEQARGAVDGQSDAIYAQADQALSQLLEVSGQIGQLTPHLERGQQLILDVNLQVSQLNATMGGIKGGLQRLAERVADMQTQIDRLRNDLTNASNEKDSRERASKALSNDLNDLKNELAKLREWLDGYSDHQQSLRDAAAGLRELAAALRAAAEGTLGELGFAGQLEGMASTAESMAAAIGELADFLNSLRWRAGDVCDQFESLMGSLDRMLDQLDDYLDIADDAMEHASDLLGSLNTLGDTAIDASRDLNQLIADFDAFHQTMSAYVEGGAGLLALSAQMSQSLSDCLASTQGLLVTMENTVRQAGGHLNSGTESTLNGLVDALQQGLDSLDTAQTLKEANHSIKDTIDEQMDKVEDETNLLDLDAELEPVSFTSAQNPAPESIQVILRTAEISAGDSREDQGDLETEPEDLGFFGRVAQVFLKIWNAILSIFR